MSFILEALKKSARERERGNIPTIEANHQTEYDLHFSRQGAGSTAKWIILLLLVLLPAIVLATWYGRQRSSNGNIQRVIPAEPTTIQPLNPQPDNAPTASIKSGITNRTEQNPLPLEPAELDPPSRAPIHIIPDIPEQQSLQQVPAREFTLSSTNDEEPNIIAPTIRELKEEEPPLLDYLPPEIRNKIPDIKLAGHAFSEIPSRRMIIINSQIVREKNFITPNLYLEEITINGIILNYDSTRFRIDIYE